MTFYDYVKENFIKFFFKLFNKQRPYLLNTKYYPEYLSFNEFNLNKEKITLGCSKSWNIVHGLD